MKKLVLSFTLLLAFAAGAVAQTQTNVDSKTCFCCGDFYQLTQPVIIGPKKVNCGDSAVFTLNKCAGAKIDWAVSPATPFTGNGTGTITLTPPLTASSYTVHATISCNGHKIETSWNLGVTLQPTDASFTFTYTDLGNGFVNINTVPAASTQVPGMLHYWGIQYNGTYPNCTACASIDFSAFTSSGVFGGYIDAAGVLHPYMGTGVTKGTSNYGINYSGFPTGSCIRITHYIRSCGVLYRSTQCVSFSKAVNKIMAKPVIIEQKTEAVARD